MKFFSKTNFIGYLLIFLIGFFIVNIHKTNFYRSTILHQVLAEEDDKHEDEKEKEDDDHKKSNSTSKSSTQEVTQIIYETIQVPSSEPGELVLDKEYKSDLDNDGIVDAFDPHPTIPEQQFFTDSDNDSIPDAEDQHPGEDDLLYLKFEDNNNNGILDIFE